MAIAAAPALIRGAAKAAPSVVEATKKYGGQSWSQLQNWFAKGTGQKLDEAMKNGFTQETALSAIEGAVKFHPRGRHVLGRNMMDAIPALTDEEWERFCNDVRGLQNGGNEELKKQSETRLDGESLARIKFKAAQVRRAKNDINNGQMTADGLLNLARLVHDVDADMIEVVLKDDPTLGEV